jgi:hypothetical protein
MTVSIKHWLQSEWRRPNVHRWDREGDFSQLANLEPSIDRRLLQRIPSWSAQVRSDTNGLVTVKGMFYDDDNRRVVLVGTDGSSDLSSCYFSPAWSLSSKTVLSSAPGNLGGLSGRNLAYYGGLLWLVGDDGKVYKGTGYTSAVAEFDADTDHKLMAPIDHRLYVVCTDGMIKRTNTSLSALYAYKTPSHDLDVRLIVPWRGYALLVARNDEGHTHLLRLPLESETPYLSDLAMLRDPGTPPSYGSLYTLHNDQLYFSPGYVTTRGSKNALNVYAFNGSRVELVTRIVHAANTGGSGFPDAAGLLSWQGRLIYYALDGTSQIFKQILPDGDVDHATLTATVTAIHPIAGSLGSRLICTAKSGSQEGIHYLTDATLSDAYLVTSVLDMGYPDRKKRLDKITVLLDGAAASFSVILKYRADGASSWTTADTLTNTQRAAVDLYASAVEFYTLQLRVDLDDNTGNDEDIAIAAVSVTYSIDT